MRLSHLAISALTLLVGVPMLSGSVVVRIEPSKSTVQLDEQFSAVIVADISQPVVGWGLDLAFNKQVLAQVGMPTIASSWQSVFSLDGDGLSALASSGVESGIGIELATITFRAQDLGQTDLSLAMTPGDATEGFPLYPSGYDSVSFAGARVTVVPEPCTGLLMLLLPTGYVLLQRRYRRA